MVGISGIEQDLLNSIHTIEFNKFQVDLKFDTSYSGSTFLSRQYVSYPFHLGRTLHHLTSSIGVTVLLQSCSGGLFEHERIGIKIHACYDTVAHVGNAAATIVHTMFTGYALSSVQIEAESGAYLEYVPNLAIVFPAARLVSEIEVVLHPGSVVVLSDGYIYHDPNFSDSIFDCLDSKLTVHDENGDLLVRDHFNIEGSTWVRKLSGISGSFSAHGSIFVLTKGHDGKKLKYYLDEVITKIFNGSSKAEVGIGMLPNKSGIVVRILSDGSDSLRYVWSEILKVLHQEIGARIEVVASS